MEVQPVEGELQIEKSTNYCTNFSQSHVQKGYSNFKMTAASVMDEDQQTSLLKNKLQVKTEALRVVSEELDKCRAQRDKFKFMAEQMQERFLYLKNDRQGIDRLTNYEESGECSYQTLDSLMEAREQNKCLKLQVETLRLKLNDAMADIKVIRSRNQQCRSSCNCQFSALDKQQQELNSLQKERQLIQQLEMLNVKCTELQSELQASLDEKHELQVEREAFKCKTHRLNHELGKALGASEPLDIDDLINENRSLQEKLLEEKQLTRQYKNMLDSKTLQGESDATVANAITQKQVQQLLQQGTISSSSSNKLRALCTTLLEALNDKSLALAHQKRANKMLASKIFELDSNAGQSPSAKLLDGYVSADSSKSDSDVVELEYCSSQVEEQKPQEQQHVPNNSSFAASFQSNLPPNLKALVDKALLNLKKTGKTNS